MSPDRAGYPPLFTMRKTNSLPGLFCKISGVGPVTLVVVTCGTQFDITMANLKSLVAFSRAHLRLLLFSDADNIQHLQDTLREWPASVLERVTYEMRLVRPPKSLAGPENCTFQRLFMPRLLSEEDGVLYVDSDAVFFHPVEDLWNYFGQMNDQQLAVVFSDVEDEALTIYNEWEMPHYKRYGINAGVMLMNLTRMRNSGLDALLLSWMDKYHHKVLDFHDQDIINTVFHHHPEKVFHGPCKWNFVHLVCLSNISCRGETPALVHGTYQTFSDSYRVPAYRAIGKAMQQVS
ncbi:glucoside xylosyltransferase 2 [Ixodes scapularis]|uniref:glucoside xylosyltransferase 2 n=1 Tax=Ixodes scapularis TaxID=6945 RepID=UPI001A9F4A78|nr:glucoside xylosyltransferase 2 [Ixodes scapularis]